MFQPSCANKSQGKIADVLEGLEAFPSSWNEFSRNRTEFSGRIVNFVVDCFLRLGVLPRSAHVSEEIVFGIWCITSKEFGWSVIECLVNFHLVLEFTDEEGNPRFGLHDVIMNYYETVSQDGESPIYESYHRGFLSQAWKLCHR